MNSDQKAMKSVSTNSELEVVSSPTKPEDRGEVQHVHDHMVAKLRLLWENRRFLSRAAAGGLLAATIIAFLIPKQFESTTRLMPPDDQAGTGLALFAAIAGKANGGLGNLATDALGLKSTGALFAAILKSRTVEDNLVNKFDLKKVYWTRHQDSARQKLAANTEIFEDRKSGIITITVSDRSPQRAAEMAQEYVTGLNAVVSQLNTSSAHRERVFLEERLQQVQRDLEVAEKDFSEFANKTGAIDIKEQGKAMVGAAAMLQGQLIAAKSELEGLRQIYSENNVRIRSLNARVTELRAQLEKVGGKEDVGEEATNQENSNSLYPSIRKLPLLGVSYADLYRRTKVQEIVFETLTQQYELAKVGEAKETPTVKVLDPPNVPEQKSYPPRLTIMLLGMFLSLLSAAMWVLLKTRWEEIDTEAPQRILAQEISQSVASKMPWATPNGSRFHAASHKVWLRLTRRPFASKSDYTERP